MNVFINVFLYKQVNNQLRYKSYKLSKLNKVTYALFLFILTKNHLLKNNRLIFNLTYILSTFRGPVIKLINFN